jgi:hypothetical protein
MMVFYVKFYFLQRYCRKIAPLIATGQPSGKCVRDYWQLSSKFVAQCQRVIWQFSQGSGATSANCTYLLEGCQSSSGAIVLSIG